MFGLKFFICEDRTVVINRIDPPPNRGIHRTFLVRRLFYRKIKHTNPDGKVICVLVSRRGATIGENVRFGYKVVVKAYAWVDDYAYIGDEVLIGKYVQVSTHAVVKDLTTIGRKAKIGTRANVGHMTKIGDRVNIAPNAWVGTGSTLGKRAKVLATVRVPVRTHAETRTTIRDNLPEAGMTVQRTKKHRRWQSAPEAQPATK